MKDIERVLVEFLDELDVAATVTYQLAQATWPNLLRIDPKEMHGSSKQDTNPGRLGLHNSFLGLASQFSLLPYIKEKTQRNGSLLSNEPPRDV